VPYLREDQIAAWEGPQAPFGARANAAAFVQSNCNVPSGRNLIVSNLLAFADLEVNSYGKCVALTGQHPPPSSIPTVTLMHTDTARRSAGVAQMYLECLTGTMSRCNCHVYSKTDCFGQEHLLALKQAAAPSAAGA